jgi:(p)ppGpp synthase/HD superfamily hydrolase
MHKRAEYGVASHFIYKESKNSYLEKSIKMLKNLKNPGKFIEGLQGDVLRDRIFVFTAGGETIDLPQGATCLDFIYAAGMPIDNQFKAIVNGKPYSLTGELSSGDNVDIIYFKKKLNGPEIWWLDHVKSTLAKEKLTEHFGSKSMEKKVELGEKILQKKLDYENQGLIYQISPSQINKILKKFNILSFELLLSKIGEGSINANEVYKELFPNIQIGLRTLIKRYAIRIFKKFTVNSVSSEKYKIRIRIDAYDRKGLLREIIIPFYEMNLPIVSIKGNGYDVTQSLKSNLVLRGGIEDPVHNFTSRVVIEVIVENHEQLITLFDKLENIPGIIKVRRIFRNKQISFVRASTIRAFFWSSHPRIMQYFSPSEHDFLPLFHGLSAYLALFMLIEFQFGSKSW